MAKNETKVKKFMPLLVGGIGAKFLIVPKGDDGDFDIESHLTMFRAQEDMVRRGLKNVKEITWKDLSSYMRLS